MFYRCLSVSYRTYPNVCLHLFVFTSGCQSSMASSQVDSLAQYLDGEYWQLKEQLRAYIDNNNLFKLR